MSALAVPQSTASGSNANRSILISIVLSVVVTLVLWALQSIFRLSTFWIFIIYIAILFLLFYFLLPKLSGMTKNAVVIS